VAEGEHGGATSEQGRAAREYRHEIVFSARAKRRHLSQRPVSCCHGFGDTIYDYNIIALRRRTWNERLGEKLPRLFTPVALEKQPHTLLPPHRISPPSLKPSNFFLLSEYFTWTNSDIIMATERLSSILNHLNPSKNGLSAM